MMVMHPAPAAAVHASLFQAQKIRRKQVRDSKVPIEAVPFPPAAFEEDSPLRPITNRIIDRPRERKPARRSVVRSESLDSDGLEGAISAPEETDKQQAEQESIFIEEAKVGSLSQSLPTDLALAGINTQQRDRRSHFTIPDVIVTSSQEDGEERHYEMRVEPTQRRVSLPLHLTAFASAIQLVDPTAEQLTPAQKVAGESKVSKAKPASPVKARKSFKGMSKLSATVKASHDGEGNEERPMPESTAQASNSSDTKVGKRTRRSSLSGLFSRKDREAAIAASALPPSPTLQWPKSASPPQSPNLTFASFFGAPAVAPRSAPASPPSNTATTSTASPPSLTTSRSPSTSPIIAQSQPSASLLSTFGKSKGKKELRAREKEERVLIKELEKVDKMVRKHDKDAKKAAMKKINDNGQGKTKKTFRGMGVFRPSAPVCHEGTSSLPAQPSSVEVVTVGRQPSLGHTSIISIPSRKNSVDDSTNAWSGDVWTDLPSPVDEQLPSLTTPSPKKSTDGSTSRETSDEEVHAALKRMSSLQRRGSGSQRVSTDKLGRHRSFKSSNSDAMVKIKRRTLLNNSFGLNLDLIDTTEMDWEDSFDPAEREEVGTAAPTLPPSKRMTLLETLYKDIEDMETNFQNEQQQQNGASAKNTQEIDARKASAPPARPPLSSARTLSKSVATTGKKPKTPPPATPLPTPDSAPQQEKEGSLQQQHRPASSVTVQRAGTLPPPYNDRFNRELPLSQSVSAPTFI